MRFKTLYEFHKIPEWYHEYFDYKRFMNVIDEHAESIHEKRYIRLRGVYFITDARKTVSVPLMTMLPEWMRPDSEAIRNLNDERKTKAKKFQNDLGKGLLMKLQK